MRAVVSTSTIAAVAAASSIKFETSGSSSAILLNGADEQTLSLTCAGSSENLCGMEARLQAFVTNQISESEARLQAFVTSSISNITTQIEQDEPSTSSSPVSCVLDLSGEMETQGTGNFVWLDRSGNGNDCTQTGTISKLNGGGFTVSGSPGSLDGCKISGSAPLNMDQVQTFEWELNLRGYGGNNNGRFLAHGTSSRNWNFCSASDQGPMRFWESNNGVTRTADGFLPLNSWVHVVATFDQTTKDMQFYKNGVHWPMTQGNSPIVAGGPMEHPGNEKTVMYSTFHDRWNNADLRSLRMYSGKKSASEITQLLQGR